jgi:hypothetical protein
MKIKLLFSVIAGIIFFCLHSCVSNKKKPEEVLKEMSWSIDSKIDSKNFQFSLPKGWYRIDTVLQGNEVTFLMKEKDDYRPIINVTNELKLVSGHNDYVQKTKRSLIDNVSGVQLIDDGKFDISGKDCIWYTYNRTQDGITREMIYYSIAHNGISTNITAGVNPGGLKKHRRVFDEIVKSFRIEN